MIFHQGYPKANGVNDYADSAVIAGLMQVFEWPDFKIPIYKDEHGNPVRCPVSNIPGDKCRNPITTTRDQLVPLAAGYYKAGNRKEAVKILRLLKERKWICPSGCYVWLAHRNHFIKCAGLKPMKRGKVWLVYEILWSAFVDPLAEPNQLMCMLRIAGRNYERAWMILNRKWKTALRNYWYEGAGFWRKEPELCEWVIKKVEGY